MSPPVMSSARQQTKVGLAEATGLPSTTAVVSGEKRTVSSTPILPPVENLRPSPQQLRNSSSAGPVPVPTPSKQPQPISQNNTNIQTQLPKEVNEHAFAANDAQASATRGIDPIAGSAQVVLAAKVPSRPAPTTQQEIGLQIEAVRNGANNPHPEVKDMAMQDV